MTAELTRTLAWLLLGTLGPAVALPTLGRGSRSGAAAVLAAAGSITLDPVAAVLLPALAALGAASMRPSSRPAGASRPVARPALRPVALVVGAVVVAVLATGPADAVDAARRAAADDHAWAVVGVGAVATVLSGPLVALLLRPLAVRLPARDVDQVEAGRVIGMLERAIVFGFLVVGAYGAAGLTVAAKGIARFPQFREEHEGYAEYVLIGTLASVALAAGGAALAALVPTR
ncbi:hypothetical protein [Patulibacter sp. SYSU D01012]|uniref:hypothetical protein n=1 Tax=Patulibacter sp. SYSU D01012 TaxID=2817381 RepID=UPI001B3077BD|nr:hypothetical protein [Patulibacter sp. SYSU D01012]